MGEMYVSLSYFHQAQRRLPAVWNLCVRCVCVLLAVGCHQRLYKVWNEILPHFNSSHEGWWHINELVLVQHWDDPLVLYIGCAVLHTSLRRIRSQHGCESDFRVPSTVLAVSVCFL